MKTQSVGREKTIGEMFDEHVGIDRAAKEAVRRALLRHKLLGQSIAAWENGKVVCIPPDQIKVNPEPLSTDDATPPKKVG